MGKLFNDSGRVLQFNGGVRRGGVTIRPDHEVRTTPEHDAMLRKDPTFLHYLRTGGDAGRPSILDRDGTFTDLLANAPARVKAEPVMVVNPRTKKNRDDVKVPEVKAPAVFAPDEVPTFGPADAAAPPASLADLTVEDALTRVNACDDLNVLRAWFDAGATAPVIDALNARGVHLVALQKK